MQVRVPSLQVGTHPSPNGRWEQRHPALQGAERGWTGAEMGQAWGFLRDDGRAQKRGVGERLSWTGQWRGGPRSCWTVGGTHTG